jgi:peptidyl-prolyl cis-trans isomerase SurA
MKRTQLIPEFGDAVFKLKKGEVTAPITYQHAVYILYVGDRKYAGIQPLSAVHTQIEHMLRTKNAQEAMEHWLERLRRNGYVKHF